MKTKWHIKTFDALTQIELYAILRLRAAVFVVEQDCVYQDIDDKDQKAIHIFAMDNEKVIAYTRLFKAGDYFQEASIGRVVVSQDKRGEGLAKDMMTQAINYIVRHFSKPIIRISAQTYLKVFYASLGFTQTGVEYLEDGLPHIGMIRAKDLGVLTP